ncbi:MAG: HD domain-containing protein [Candidatus Helarchaeota archaeon]
MNLDDIISNIVDYNFDNFGIHDKFPKKARLLIHDNVHGTLEFTDYERKVINSPFLQRLTQIKQVGLAHFLYPGCVHHRFSHSLGVSHIANKIIQNIFESNKNEVTNSVRLAGLLHDIGFGPFSHVSDRIYKVLEYFPDYNKKDYVDKLLKKEIPNLGARKNVHEIIGFLLLKSKRLKELLEDIYKNEDIDLDLVPLLITGNHLKEKIIDDEKKVAVKIINGFSDADKIDYIFRDSFFTGLPLPIDFDRLLPFFTKICLNDDCFELGVDIKGARAFHLLLTAKTKMFSTIYHHHTTIAFESLLIKGIINAIRNFNEIETDKYRPLTGALDLLYHTDNSILNFFKTINNPISNDVFNRLNKRKHYRRIIQLYDWELSNRLIKSPMKYAKEKGIKNLDYKEYENYKDTQIKKISDFKDKIRVHSNVLDFKKELVKKAGKKDVLNKFSYLDKTEENDIIDYVIEIHYTEVPSKKPYKQPYVNVYDSIANCETILSLEEMGYRSPKDKEILSIIFYALPEIVELLTVPLKELLKEKIGNEILRKISLF